MRLLLPCCCPTGQHAALEAQIQSCSPTPGCAACALWSLRGWQVFVLESFSFVLHAQTGLGSAKQAEHLEPERLPGAGYGSRHTPCQPLVRRQAPCLAVLTTKLCMLVVM